MIKLFVDYGADLDVCTPKDWTPLSYCKAKGKYGATEEKGIYPEVGGGDLAHGMWGVAVLRDDDTCTLHRRGAAANVRYCFLW